MHCYVCPRKCLADRSDHLGTCLSDNQIKVSRIAPHLWEEPPLSGSRGAGTVFFCGCSLHCVYCQNKDISSVSDAGRAISSQNLINEILAMIEKYNVHCIEFVTPTHYTHLLWHVLRQLKTLTKLPIVWNSSGYERIEALRALDGLVDVYLPDFKYADAELARKYSGAPDYPSVAKVALREMYRQTGPCVFDEDGLIKKGVIVRHLVLPGSRHNSEQVLDTVAKAVPVNNIKFSLMNQYTPDFALDSPFPELHRRVTSFEYKKVLDHAVELGFDGYFQERSSADKKYTPDFNEN